MSNFDLKSNRLDYGNLLTPVPGFALKAAVATTYSLDLQTLVASTISLGLGEATDSELRKSPLSLLAALLKVVDKTLIFCDSAQIKFPAKKTKLLMTLEKSVIPVSLPAKEGTANYPSFHPKCWILQFEHFETKEHKYRFIALSRNLTFDRSWDVSVALEGDENGNRVAKTKPICDFIKFLRTQVNENDSNQKSRLSFIDALLEDLKHVTFDTDNHNDFIDFEILPIGIGSIDINRDELFSQKEMSSMAVMSPFVSAKTIESLLCEKSFEHRPALITRRSELEKLSEISQNFDVFCLKNDIVDGEESVSEDDSDSEKDDMLKQDVHAKIYSFESSSGNCLYLGSMNASYNGANRNVEMLVKLTTVGYYPETFLKDIGVGCEKSAFEVVALPKVNSSINSSEFDYESVFKQIVRMSASAKIKEVGENLYDVDVSFEDFSDVNYDVRIVPLFAEGLACNLQKNMKFNGMHLDQLSMFYEISIDEEKRLCMIPTEGIPDNRDKKIVTEIISSKKKLAEYIAFVLGESSYSQEGDDDIDDGDSDVDDSNSLAGENFITPIYERMLKASYVTPEKIRDIEYVIRLIDDERIVTPEFKELYNTFKSVLGI